MIDVKHGWRISDQQMSTHSYKAEPGLSSQRGDVSPRPQSRTVLIGPMSVDPTESVSSVNRSFVQGLDGDYEFIPLAATRTLGNAHQARLNMLNGFYFVDQCARWLTHLVFRRPRIAHYAISSGWAMEKGLVFMKLARMCGAKTVGHLHSGGFVDHWRNLPGWRKHRALREFARLDAFILASRWWRSEIAKHIPLSEDKLWVVNNPIDYSFEKAALALPIQPEREAVLSLGVMGRAKGVFDILQAVKTASGSCRLRINVVGSEREPGVFSAVNEFVSANRLLDVVQVRQAISDQDKLGLYRQAGVFLLPSYYENFPLVIIEAAAAGMAIVTTPVGAVPEFFQDGVSALFVEPGNSGQIAQAIEKLANDPQLRQRLGLAAREVFVSRLSRARIMKSLQDVYAKVLSQ